MLIYTRLLKYPLRGADVKTLQSALVKLGYNTKGVDGIFGVGTQKAVRLFQSNNKLLVDGIVGPQTIRVLNANLYNITEANVPMKKIYSKMRYYSSNVHVVTLNSKEYFVDIDLGRRWKLERVSDIIKNKMASNAKIVAGTNAGFFNFNASSEHLGLFIDEGLYYSQPSQNFIDFLYYKTGEVAIKNLHGYDKGVLSKLQAETYWSIGTSYSLIQNGAINLENADRFDHSKYRHPRTLLGWKKDGTFLLVVVDGRSSMNLGVTASQSAYIMQSLGAYQAVNLDGGGSSTMVLVENGRPVVKNKLSGGAERSVGSVLLAYKK